MEMVSKYYIAGQLLSKALKKRNTLNVLDIANGSIGTEAERIVTITVLYRWSPTWPLLLLLSSDYDQFQV